MAKVEIPEPLRGKLGPEMKMDVHWVDVKLRDGRVVKKLVARGGRYITGRAEDLNGEGEVPFSTEDIKKVRRHSVLPFW
jgi:hypothetical protein